MKHTALAKNSTLDDPSVQQMREQCLSFSNRAGSVKPSVCFVDGFSLRARRFLLFLLF